MYWPNPVNMLKNIKKKKIFEDFRRNLRGSSLDEKVQKQIRATIRLEQLEYEYLEEIEKKRKNGEILKGRLKKEKGKNEGFSNEKEKFEEKIKEYGKGLELSGESEISIEVVKTVVEKISKKSGSVNSLHKSKAKSSDLSEKSQENLKEKSENLKKKIRKFRKSPPIYLENSKDLFVHIIGKLPPICDPASTKSIYKSPSRLQQSSLIDYTAKAHPSHHTFRNIENEIKLSAKLKKTPQNYSNSVKNSVRITQNINLSLEIEARKQSNLKKLNFFPKKKIFTKLNLNFS